MARKSSGTILQEELYPAGFEPREDFPPNLPREESPRETRTRGDRARATIDDARLVDLDVDEESPFLRGQKRVSARRSSLPKRTATRLLWTSGLLTLLCIAALA